jgi:hypothetical protein
MSLVTKFGVGQRKFYGNRYTKKVKATDVRIASTSCSNLDVSAASASIQKLKHVKNVTDDNFCVTINNSASGNIIIDMNVLCNLLKKSLICISCDVEKCIEIFEDVNCRKGLSSKLSIVCSACGAKQST